MDRSCLFLSDFGSFVPIHVRDFAISLKWMFTYGLDSESVLHLPGKFLI